MSQYKIAKRVPYKLIKFGDPLLKQVCQPVEFPLSDEIDKTIDECMNTLVTND
jgi:peptide deformylase